MPVNLENPAVAIGLFSFQSQCQRMFKPPHSCTHLISVQLSSVAQPCLTLCDPWTAARQASLSITNSQSLPKLMPTESVMPSNHLILCCPLLLLPSILPSIRVFSNELVLCIRWPKYWSFSISPFNECSGLISFRIDRFDLPHMMLWGNPN